MRVCVYVCARAFGTASDIIKEMTCSDEAVRVKIFHVAAKSTAGAAVVSQFLPVLSQLCKRAGQCNHSTRVACWAISSQ